MNDAFNPPCPRNYPAFSSGVMGSIVITNENILATNKIKKAKSFMLPDADSWA